MNDSLLYSTFISGDFKSLYRDFYPALISYASSILGANYSFLCEDCVQDSIFNTYLQRNKINNSSALKSYLYTAVRNNAISILRKGNAKSNYVSFVGQSQHKIELEFTEQETLRQLFAAIEQLPKSYRELLELSFGENLHISEIAQRLNVSISTINKRRAKIIEELRVILKDFDPIIVLILISLFNKI